MKTETVNNVIAGFIFAVAILGVIFIALWIIQVAFSYFGFEFTLWQSFVIVLASSILFKTNYAVSKE